MSVEVVNLLRQKILSNKDDYSAWILLGSLLLGQRNIAGLNELLTYRHGLGMSAVELAWRICWEDLTRDPASTAVDGVADALDDTNAFSGAFLVGKGCAELRRYRLDSGVALVREGYRRLAVLRDLFPFEALDVASWHHLTIVAFLFEKTGWASAVPLGEADGPISVIAETPKGSHSLTCCAFAESTYFLRYAERFLATLRQNGVAGSRVMLGLINPSEEARALGVALARAHACGIVAVPYGGEYLAEFAASARFILAEEIIAAAAEPVIFLDIDAVFPQGADRVLLAAAAQPLACIETAQLPPHLQVDASVVAAQPGPVASRFFKDAKRYLLAKLREVGPLWTFDQVALHRAVALARDRGDLVASLNDVLGSPVLPRLFKADHTMPFKQRSVRRSNAGLACTGLDEELRPTWTQKG